MTTNNREACIKATLKWEGGYSNDAADPGGPTNWGITIADARKYWKQDATAQDVRAMPQNVAIDIYRSKYWKTKFYDCDKLEAGVDLAVFDFGVNSGVGRAKKYNNLSESLTPEQKINKIFDEREAFLRGLSTFPVFGKGWMNRTKDLRKQALAMSKTPSIVGPKTVGPAIVVTTGAAAAMKAPHLLAEILIGTVIAAVLVWLGIHFYKKWKTNV